MNKFNEDKPLAGWEREFWNLLSPETTKLLKVELAKRDKPCVVCGRTTTQAETIDYECCRDLGR